MDASLITHDWYIQYSTEVDNITTTIRLDLNTPGASTRTRDVRHRASDPEDKTESKSVTV